MSVFGEAVTTMVQQDAKNCTINICISLPQTICKVCNCVVDDEDYKRLLAEKFPHCGFETRKQRFLRAARNQLIDFEKSDRKRSWVEPQRYVCKVCFAERLLNSKFSYDGLYIPCPFKSHQYMPIGDCFSFLSRDDAREFERKLARHKEEKNFFRYFCPFSEGGETCCSSTLYSKEAYAQERFTRCSKHEWQPMRSMLGRI